MFCLIYRLLRARARRSSTSPSARSRGSLLAHHLADIAQSGGSLAAIQRHAKATIDEVGRAHVHDETRWLADIPGNNVVDRLRCKFKNEYDIDMEPYYVTNPYDNAWTASSERCLYSDNAYTRDSSGHWETRHASRCLGVRR